MRIKFSLSVLSLSILIATSTPVHGEEAAMTQKSADELIAATKFRAVKSKNAIPKIWWQAAGLEGVSDIGGPFSSGCTGPEPHSRLMAGAVSDDYAAFIVEQGGIAYLTQLRIFKREKSTVKNIYSELLRDQRLAEVRKKLGS